MFWDPLHFVIHTVDHVGEGSCRLARPLQSIPDQESLLVSILSCSLQLKNGISGLSSLVIVL